MKKFYYYLYSFSVLRFRLQLKR